MSPFPACTKNKISTHKYYVNYYTYKIEPIHHTSYCLVNVSQALQIMDANIDDIPSCCVLKVQPQMFSPGKWQQCNYIPHLKCDTYIIVTNIISKGKTWQNSRESDLYFDKGKPQNRQTRIFTTDRLESSLQNNCFVNFHDLIKVFLCRARQRGEC